MAHLVIRTDASVSIGSGHVMRCSALAQAWQALGGTVQFVCAALPAALASRLTAFGWAVQLLECEAGSQADAAQTAQVAQASACVVVLDGYHFDAAYQQTLLAAGQPCLLLDDYGHAAAYYTTWVLNQNANASAALYPQRAAHTELLLGLRYLLLRPEFAAWEDWRREYPPQARQLLITLGGTDPHNTTLTVLQALARLPERLSLRVVLGAANPHLAALQACVATLPQHDVALLQGVDDMPAQMAWADVAITAGGSTCWELALLQVPMAVIITAENQAAIVQNLEERGLIQALGWYNKLAAAQLATLLQPLLHDAARRAQMGALGRQLVDSAGARRVAERLWQSRQG